MEALANCDELSVFEIDAVKDIIDYKWEVFASKVHTRGFYIHLTYVFSLLLYINNILLVDGEKPANYWVYLNIIALCLVYPLFYDGN
jgi:hypothetical protein